MKLTEKLYNELFEIILELYEGMEVEIEENDYSDYINEITYNIYVLNTNKNG